ncbi:hypothetical protein CN403_23975 [Bacillus cereus]|nr:hypothetical protein CN403_23975 [Bacillus cereus]
MSLFELLREIARAVVRELSAYVLRKQLQKKGQHKNTLHHRKLKRGYKKRRDVDSISSFFSLCNSVN